MKPCEFDYVSASSMDHALELLAEHRDEAKLLAGGQSLVATLNMRLSAPALLIDINGLDELSGISLAEDCLRIAALTRHAEVLHSELVGHHVPLLAMALEHVAHPAIRNRGTHGGSIAFADPAAEIPACALALNASIIVRNKATERKIPAREFFHDLYDTALAEDEILTAIEYPLAGAGSFFFFREFARRKGDFANTGLALAAEKNGKRFTSLSPVFFAVANTPFLAAETAARLVDVEIDEAAIDGAKQALAGELPVIGDIYAGEAMKLHLAGHFLEQALLRRGESNE